MENLKTYSVEITAVTKKATEQIDKLEKELDGLASQKGLSSGLQSQIDKIQEQISGLKGQVTSSTQAIQNSIKSVSADKMALEFKQMSDNVSKSMSSLRTDIEALQGSMKVLQEGDFSSLTNGLSKSFDDLSNNVDTVITKFSNVSKLVSDIQHNILPGSIISEAEVAKNQSNTQKYTADTDKMVTQLKKDIDEINSLKNSKTNNLDQILDYDLHVDNLDQALDNVTDLVKRIIQNVNKLKNVKGVDLNELFKGGISEKEINSIYKDLSSEFDDVEKKVGADKPIAVRFKMDLESDAEGDSAIKSLVNKIKNYVIPEVNKRIKSTPIRIPLGYTTELDGDETKKELESVEKDATGLKGSIKKIKVAVEANQASLLSDIKSKIVAVNKDLKAPGAPKLEVDVVGRLNTETFKKDANKINADLLDTPLDADSLNLSTTGTMNIGETGNLATESTLLDIKSILGEIKSNGLLMNKGAVDVNGSLNAQSEKTLQDYINTLKIRSRGNVLNAETQGRLDLLESTQARLALLNQQGTDLKTIISAVKSGNIDKLQSTSYYKDSVMNGDKQLAKYGGGDTVEAWQAKLTSDFNETHSKIVEATKQNGILFNQYLSGEEVVLKQAEMTVDRYGTEIVKTPAETTNWKELLINDLKARQLKDTSSEQKLRDYSIKNPESVKAMKNLMAQELVEQANQNSQKELEKAKKNLDLAKTDKDIKNAEVQYKTAQARAKEVETQYTQKTALKDVSTEQASLRLIAKDYSERIQAIQESSEISAKYEDDILNIKQKTLEAEKKNILKNYLDAQKLTNTQIKAQNENLINASGAQSNMADAKRGSVNRKAEPNEYLFVKDTLKDIDHERGIELQTIGQEIDALINQKNVMTEILDLTTKSKTESLSPEEQKRLETKKSELLITRDDIESQESLKEITSQINELEAEKLSHEKELGKARNAYAIAETTKAQDSKEQKALNNSKKQYSKIIQDENLKVGEIQKTIDDLHMQASEQFKTTVLSNVTEVENIVKSKLETTETLIDSLQKTSKTTIGSTQSAKSELLKKFVIPDDTQEGYDKRAKEIEDINKQLTRYYKLAQQRDPNATYVDKKGQLKNAKSSIDNNSLLTQSEILHKTELEKTRDILKLNQLAYENINKANQENLNTSEQSLNIEKQITSETQNRIKTTNLPLSEKTTQDYLSLPTNSNDYKTNMELSQLEASKEIVGRVITELTQAIDEEAQKDNGLVEAKMRDVASKMIKEDIKALEYQVAQEENKLEINKKRGVSQGVLDESYKKRVQPIKDDILRLKGTQVDIPALQAEKQHLEDLKAERLQYASIQKEAGGVERMRVEDRNAMMSIDEAIVKSEENIALLQEKQSQFDNLRNKRLDLYVKQQQQSMSQARSELQRKEKEATIIDEAIVSAKQQLEVDKQRQLEEQKIIEAKQKEQSLSVATQKKHINQEYDPKIEEKSKLLASIETQLNTASEKALKFSGELDEIKNKSASEYVRLDALEKTQRIGLNDNQKKRQEAYQNKLAQLSQLNSDLYSPLPRNKNENDNDYELRQAKAVEQRKENIARVQKEINDLQDSNNLKLAQETQQIDETVKAKKNVLKASGSIPKGFSKLNSSQKSEYRQQALEQSQQAELEYNKINSQYLSKRSSLGAYDDTVIELGKQLTEARGKYVQAVMTYMGAGGTIDQVSESFQKASNETLAYDQADIKVKKELVDKQVAETSQRKQTVQSAQDALMADKQRALQQVDENKRLKEQNSLLEEAFQKTKKTRFQSGMDTKDKRFASYKVDTQLTNIDGLMKQRGTVDSEINNLNSQINSLDKESENYTADVENLNAKIKEQTSKYNELSQAINEARSQLKTYRKEGEGLNLKTSPTTGRLYANDSQKDVKLKGVSYTGFDLDKVEQSKANKSQLGEIQSDAKAVREAQDSQYQGQLKITDEVKNTNSETKKWYLGMTSEERKMSIEYLKITNQLKYNKKLTEEETNSLKAQRQEIVNQNKERIKFDETTGFSSLKSGAENLSGVKNLLAPTDSNALATENTLREIRNILAGGKLQVSSTSGYNKNTSSKKTNWSDGMTSEQIKDANRYLSLNNKVKKNNKYTPTEIKAMKDEMTLIKERNKDSISFTKKGFAKLKNVPDSKSNQIESGADEIGKQTEQLEDSVEKEISDINIQLRKAKSQLGRKNLSSENRDKWEKALKETTESAKSKGYTLDENGLVEHSNKAIEDINNSENEQIDKAIKNNIDETVHEVKNSLKQSDPKTQSSDTILKDTVNKTNDLLKLTEEEIENKLSSILKESSEIQSQLQDPDLVNKDPAKYSELVNRHKECTELLRLLVEEQKRRINEVSDDLEFGSQKIEEANAQLNKKNISSKTKDKWTNIRNENQQLAREQGYVINSKGYAELVQSVQEEEKMATEAQQKVQKQIQITTKELDKQSIEYQDLIDIAKKHNMIIDDQTNVKQTKTGNTEKYLIQNNEGTSQYVRSINAKGEISETWTDINKLSNGYNNLKNSVKETQKAIDSLHGNKIDLLSQANPDMYGEEADNIIRAKKALIDLYSVKEQGFVDDDGKFIYSEEDLKNFQDQAKMIQNISSQIYGKMKVGDKENLGIISDTNIAKERVQLEQLANATTKGVIVNSKYIATNNELAYSVKTADGTLQNYSITCNRNTGIVEKALVSEQKYVNGFQQALAGLNEKFHELLRYTLASVSIYQIFNFFKQGLTVVREMDAAMTELRKVSNDTEEALGSFRKEAYNIASTIGSTGKEIVNSAADWSKLGYAINEASELAKNSALYANVGDMDIDTATEHMVSTLKAFNIEASNSISIVDKFNEIGNNYAITSEGIGTALERSGAALVAAGNDIDQSIALVTAGNLVQQDPEMVGNALKVVSLRVRGAKTDLESMGEETDGLADSTSKLRSELMALTGVDIMESDGKTFKSTYEQLLEISKVWDKLTDVSQANVLEKLAGKTRSSVVAGLINNMSTAEEVLQDSQNASGSAIAENQKYLESIQGHLDVLTNKWQQVWDAGINRDFINFWISLGTDLLDVVDKIGLVQTAFGGLFAYLSVKSLAKSSGSRAKKLALI